MDTSIHQGFNQHTHIVYTFVEHISGAWTPKSPAGWRGIPGNAERQQSSKSGRKAPRPIHVVHICRTYVCMITIIQCHINIVYLID